MSAHAVVDDLHLPIGERAPILLSAALTFAEMLDLLTETTALHSRTVSRYAELTARQLGMPNERVERVRIAGLVHDVGMIAIPDRTLLKPGALTEAEWSQMRNHPEIGARLLSSEDLADIQAWVLAHHERPDGGGYPYGLTSREIPLEAQILAVADSFEAMTNNRTYRLGLGHAAACDELRRGASTQYDARVVDAFLEGISRRIAGIGGSPASLS